MNLLHRFWFRFRNLNAYADLRLGCGVTAYSYDDALLIMANTVFAGKEMPEVERFIEDVDVSTLDQKHVAPNMDPPVWRGVWFPKGYPLPG